MHYKELLKNQKILQLTKTLGYWLGVYSALIVFYLILSDYLETTTNNMLNEKQQVVSETTNLKRLRIDTEAKINEVLKAKEIWHKVKSSRRDGLKIDSIKQIIDALRVKYHLTGAINITISAPTVIKNAIKSESTQIVSSNVRLSVSAMTDVFVLQFLEELLATVPGYLTIISLNLDRNNTAITEGLLDNMSRKISTPLVTMEVEFLWRDFNDINLPKS
jgi:hypothetical protein